MEMPYLTIYYYLSEHGDVYYVSGEHHTREQTQFRRMRIGDMQIVW